MLTAAVNQHYLDKVMNLAQHMPVIATEDIYDARGNKLLARGAKVTQVLQEKLILHKLTRPIEMSLSVAGGVDARLIAGTAERLIGRCAALSALVEATRDRGPTPVAILAPLQFGNAMTMMLTIVERGGDAALDHAVMVAVIAVCMAKAARLTEEDQRNCALAGLLHDIGELYVNPLYLTPGRALAPHEWAHLVVHPKTAQMLVDELESYPKSVGRAIAEHHERRDGSGYPRRLAGPAISACGQVLAVAEAVSGLLLTEHPLERAEIALKLMPHEHDRAFLAAISGARRFLGRTPAEAFGQAGAQAARPGLYRRVLHALELCAALNGAPGLSAQTRERIDCAHARLRVIQRAAVSCGLDLELLPDADDFDGLLHFECAVVAREVTWRMKDLARDLSISDGTQLERAALAPLLAALDPADPQAGAAALAA